MSLILARFLTNYLWSKGHDPDMYAMPIHSSVVDLVGQLLLVMCFEVVCVVGRESGGSTRTCSLISKGVEYYRRILTCI